MLPGTDQPRSVDPERERCRHCADDSGASPLYEDRDWVVRPAPTHPDWLVLWLRRHAEAITELSPDELASLGPMLARMSSIVREATAAERVYLQVFGEQIPHFHFVIVPRGPDVPPSQRGAALLLTKAAEDEDETAAAALHDRIREALAGPIR